MCGWCEWDPPLSSFSSPARVRLVTLSHPLLSPALLRTHHIPPTTYRADRLTAPGSVRTWEFTEYTEDLGVAHLFNEVRALPEPFRRPLAVSARALPNVP